MQNTPHHPTILENVRKVPFTVNDRPLLVIGMIGMIIPTGGYFIPMARAIGMNIGMIIPGIFVGCSIGIRLWMNHLGFVFLSVQLKTLKRLKVPEDSSNFDDFWTELLLATFRIV